jgi:predicted dehydrogenase
MIRVGFIGLGDMGLYQANSFAQVADCHLVAGADPSPEMRTRFAKNFPDATLFASPEELLTGAQVDGVVIAVPTGYHQQIATKALTAHIPVLLEKPMARTVAQCQQLIEDAEQRKTLLMVAHCRRFDPYWMAWGDKVTSGALGTPILWRDARARINARNWFMDDALGGGPLLDGAIHNYDFANWIFGEPESVYASAVKLNPNVSAIDTASAIIRYHAGHQLMVSWSWGAKGTTLHDIIGPDGFIQFGTGTHTPPAEEKGQFQYCTLTNRDGDESLIKVEAKPDMYVRQAEHFLACIRGEAICQSPGTEAIKAVAVAEAILQSTRDGKVQTLAW